MFSPVIDSSTWFRGFKGKTGAECSAQTVIVPQNKQWSLFWKYSSRISFISDVLCPVCSVANKLICIIQIIPAL